MDSTAAAEYVITDGEQLHQYQATSDETLAVLIQPLACVLYALRNLDVTGKHVTVLGLGPIGLLFAHEVSQSGAGRVTGVDMIDRRAMAGRFGIDDLVNGTAATWAKSSAANGSPDIVIEAVGHQTATFQNAIDGCAPGGQILYFGIPDEEKYPLDMEQMVRKNLTLRAGVARDRAAMLALADAQLATDLPVYRDLITDVLPFDRVQQAFQTACHPRAGQAKIIVHS